MKEQVSPALAELMKPENPEEKIELAPGMTTEEIKALFFDSDALREPCYRIHQLNADGYRYYYTEQEDGKITLFPSVTTLLKKVMPTSPQLIEWIAKNGMEGATEKRDLAAAYGTFMHIQFEKLIISRKYDFEAVPGLLLAYMEQENLPEKFFGDSIVKIKKDVLAFAQFVRDYNVKPLAVEIGLVHPVHHYAGCIDLPCVMTDPKTGKQFTAIVDFKSGRKGFFEEHELQLHLYRAMWNYNFPDSPVEKVFNFSPKDWRTKPTYNLKDQTESENVRKLPHLLAIAAIEDEKRDNVVTIVRGALDLDNGELANNIVTLSLVELIKSKQAEKEPESAPVEDSPEKTAEIPVNATNDAGVINDSSEQENPVKTEIPEKLPEKQQEQVEQENLLNFEMEL